MAAELALGSTAAVLALLAAGIAARPEDEATAQRALEAAKAHLEAVRAKNNKPAGPGGTPGTGGEPPLAPPPGGAGGTPGTGGTPGAGGVGGEGGEAGGAGGEPPSADDVPGWGHAVAPDGRTYWWDLATNKTQWNKPETPPKPGDEPPPLLPNPVFSKDACEEVFKAAETYDLAKLKKLITADSSLALCKKNDESLWDTLRHLQRVKRDDRYPEVRDYLDEAAEAERKRLEAAAAAAAAAAEAERTRREAEAAEAERKRLEAEAAAPLALELTWEQAVAHAKEVADKQPTPEARKNTFARLLPPPVQGEKRIDAVRRALAIVEYSGEDQAAILYARNQLQKELAKEGNRRGGRRVLTFRRKLKSRSKNGRRPTRKSAVRRNR